MSSPIDLKAISRGQITAAREIIAGPHSLDEAGAAPMLMEALRLLKSAAWGYTNPTAPEQIEIGNLIVHAGQKSLALGDYRGAAEAANDAISNVPTSNPAREQTTIDAYKLWHQSLLAAQTAQNYRAIEDISTGIYMGLQTSHSKLPPEDPLREIFASVRKIREEIYRPAVPSNPVPVVSAPAILPLSAVSEIQPSPFPAKIKLGIGQRISKVLKRVVAPIVKRFHKQATPEGPG